MNIEKAIKPVINDRSRLGADDRIFYAVSYVMLTALLITVLYPLIYILAASFSSAKAVSLGKVVLFPVDFSLTGYKAVFTNKDILTGYINTIFYTLVGTVLNVAVTIMAAYPMSRKDLPGRGLLMFFFTFIMLFGGGLVPYYIQVRDLGLINKVWVMLIPGLMSVYNMIIMRTSIQSNIPVELLEAARMDGCSDINYLLKVVLPLSKATIAVIALFYAVGRWNAFFEAFLFLSERKLYPLQLILREILIDSKTTETMLEDPELLAAKQGLADLLKYSLIVVSTAPIMLVYPFIQRYFIKGVMIGSLKG